MTESALLAIAGVAFVFTLMARRLSTGILTGPMIFLALGLGIDQAGLVKLDHAETSLHVLAELTLVIVLFADASMVKLAALHRRFVWPERMLLGGLPLAILFGVLVGMVLLPHWPFWEIALLAAILAPTDAALGQAVVTNPVVPERVREGLTVESGVNDGLALPAVLMFGCLAVGGVHENVQENWLIFALEQIGYGAFVGAVAGGLGAILLSQAKARNWTNEAFEGIATLALAGLCYLVAIEVGGNGFLAAFVGGLSFGALMKQSSGFMSEFMETEGQLLVLGTFLLLGASIAPIALANAEPVWIVLIVFSLFVVRPAAIWLSLWRTDAPPLAKGFMGWFGPRGLATALFALLVVGQLPGVQRGEEILSISVLAVLISAVLHGVTAAPGARWFARHLETAEPKPKEMI